MGEVAAFSKGCGYSKSDLKDSGIPVILYGRLYTNYETVIKEVDTFVDCIGGAVYSKGGEIITPSSGETSEDISIASVVEKSGILLSGDLNIIYPQNLLDSIFIAISISNGKPHKDMAKRAQGKSIVHLHNGDLAQIEIDYPSIDEQTRISSYFHSLDHLITLHQSKSFESFFVDAACCTLSWEQRKAKEMCNIGTGKSNTQDQVEDGIYPFYIRSDIPAKSNKYLYDCESVITIGDGNIGRVFHYVNGKFDLHQRCYKMTDFQNVWGKYFYYFFSTRFYDRAMKMTAKATVDSVRLEMISEMDILKPAKIDEQKKISEFFSYLDHLITLHQLEPYYRIFKAIAYRIIDYAEYKFFNVKINLIYDIIRINIA